jgi:hypothetical protein
LRAVGVTLPLGSVVEFTMLRATPRAVLQKLRDAVCAAGVAPAIATHEIRHVRSVRNRRGASATS